MANSIDPDQTAASGTVRSGSKMFAETCLSQYSESYSNNFTTNFIQFSFSFQLSQVWGLIGPIVAGLQRTDETSPSSPTTKSPVNSLLNNGITV